MQLVLAAVVALLLLPLLEPAAASSGDPFTGLECQSGKTGKPGCNCRWKVDKGNLQCNGLAEAPPEAQPSAATCEKWCCDCTAAKNCKFKDDPAGPVKFAQGTGPCAMWQWSDPKVNSGGGCYVGVEHVGKGDTGEIYKCLPNTIKGASWVGAGGNLGPPSKWGEPFMLIFFVALTVYATGGLALGHQSGKKELKKMHPHHRGWSKLRALVTDGIFWTVGKVTGSPSKRGYDKVATAAAVAKAQAQAFRKDEKVQYYSASKKEWVGATVKKIHSDGKIDLDVKKGVKPDQVRAINVITKIEKVKIVDKKAEKKLKEMQDKLKKAKKAAKSANSAADKERAELEAAKAQATLDKEESKKAIAAAEDKAKKAGAGKSGAKGDGRWVMAKEDSSVRLGAR